MFKTTLIKQRHVLNILTLNYEECNSFEIPDKFRRTANFFDHKFEIPHML